MFAHRLLTGSAVVALVIALSACAAEEEPMAEPETPEPVPTVVESETPEPTPLAFVMPSDCTTILPQERLDSFAEQNLELLGGPGSLYGDDYFFDPTPEQFVGGISCVYAEDGTDLSSLLVSVAPITAATRAGVVNDLANQGLNENTTDEGAVTYSQFGDEAAAPAIYNIIRDDSWISVISAFGGQVFYDEAVMIADEVAGEVYQ
ncbi:hypothetical protein [Microcella sp.]|uniref:hypothetical protein n=1 Tax=Microcella sp. TaxID=1913979 RepID=UPI002568EED3|nr:hypothetical protein [Microcella sp.]MBX9471205.1 hypothetical protein [Microcella sp.]